jgi:hypothetical protein
MERQTLVNYIRCSAVPYPTIIERAVKGGWSIEKDTTVSDNDDRDTRTVTLGRGKETPVIICYYIEEPTAALFTCTSLKGAM